MYTKNKALKYLPFNNASVNSNEKGFILLNGQKQLASFTTEGWLEINSTFDSNSIAHKCIIAFIEEYVPIACDSSFLRFLAFHHVRFNIYSGEMIFTEGQNND